MSQSPGRFSRPWRMYFAWLFVGAFWALSVLSIASIGILLLPLAGVATWLVARRPGASRGWPGLLGVVGLPFYLLASVHRSAQDGILSSNGPQVTGFKPTNPWPWLGVSVACTFASVVVFLVTTRQSRSNT